jgi:2-polyprenyl-6-methoxyphenol hydroxylase-like FAD-dependent oxidoreductase
MAEGDVLIVGAGPVGLTLAISLYRQNIPFRIIDKAPGRNEQTRAVALHARSIESLARIGLNAFFFIHEGTRLGGFIVHSLGAFPLFTVNFEDLPTRYPFVLGYSQADLERFLAQELDNTGNCIQRSTEIVDITQDDEYVYAVLKNERGAKENVRVRYVLACDGAHSFVRRHLNVPLTGSSIDWNGLVVDVKMDWARRTDQANAYLLYDGAIFIMPLGVNHWRFFLQLGRSQVKEKATLETVQRLLHNKLKLDPKKFTVLWFSAFVSHTQVAQTFQRGRVFLFGDAAHTHSPLGGQGMNTGLQDAINFAWKFGLHLRGRAHPVLLESYAAEREANAQQLYNLVYPMTFLFLLRHPWTIYIRDTILQFLAYFGMCKWLARTLSELQIHYAKSSVIRETGSSWASLFARWTHLQQEYSAKWEFLRRFKAFQHFRSGPAAGARAPEATLEKVLVYTCKGSSLEPISTSYTAWEPLYTPTKPAGPLHEESAVGKYLDGVSGGMGALLKSVEEFKYPSKASTGDIRAAREASDDAKFLEREPSEDETTGATQAPSSRSTEQVRPPGTACHEKAAGEQHEERTALKVVPKMLSELLDGETKHTLLVFMSPRIELIASDLSEMSAGIGRSEEHTWNTSDPGPLAGEKSSGLTYTSLPRTNIPLERQYSDAHASGSRPVFGIDAECVRLELIKTVIEEEYADLIKIIVVRRCSEQPPISAAAALPQEQTREGMQSASQKVDVRGSEETTDPKLLPTKRQQATIPHSELTYHKDGLLTHVPPSVADICRAYGAADECLYLIRPDGYIGYRSQPIDVDDFRKYANTLFV